MPSLSSSLRIRALVLCSSNLSSGYSWICLLIETNQSLSCWAELRSCCAYVGCWELWIEEREVSERNNIRWRHWKIKKGVSILAFTTWMVLKINNAKRHQQNLGQDGREDQVSQIPLTKTFNSLFSKLLTSAFSFSFSFFFLIFCIQEWRLKVDF